MINNFFTIYADGNLSADEGAGLQGDGWPVPADRMPCDFILAKDIGTFDINYPILSVVEAKKNDLDIGIPQCAAQLVGTRIFNEKKSVTISKLYGCVTTGENGPTSRRVFMRLMDNELLIDVRKYYLVEIGELLALFVDIINQFRAELG